MKQMNKIRGDVFRYMGSAKAIDILKCWYVCQGFRVTYFMRMAKEGPKVLRRFYKLMFTHYMCKYGVQTDWSLDVGRGFYIGHFGSIIIGSGAKIGNNCNINQGVTIGIENRGERKGFPTIGNRVWIGANSVVVGKITIGNNVLIAPLTFVNFDVPDNSIVVGNPAKILNRDNATEGYICNIVE